MTEAKKEYPRPSLTADVVVVALGEGPPSRLRVLFIRRAHAPFEGAWALPGGFVEPTETAAEGATRELAEETGLTNVRLEEIGCFSAPGRDPRGWVVSIAHLALVPENRVADAKAGDDAAEIAWLDVTLDRDSSAVKVTKDGAPVEALAFDHRAILEAAAGRLRVRVDELSFELLPPTFVLADARRPFEAILGAPLQDQVLRERLVKTGLVREAIDEPGRYRFGAVLRRWPWAPAGG